VEADALQAEASAASRGLPILQIHGDYDPMVPVALAEWSRDRLVEAGHDVQWREYPMQHEVCAEELAAISEWLAARLPPLP
jgi:phospholipase/carboxylesterase